MTEPRMPINAIAARQVALLHEAIVMLDRDGHAVIDARLEVGRPTVELQASARLACLADEQRGAYYVRGVDDQGQRYRRGQLLKYRNVKVIWTERGH